MNSKMFILILGMGIVTYIPRAIPAVLIEKMKISPPVEKFLRLVPYTAMAALIFPAILSVDTERIYIGILGGIVAGVCAWKGFPVMVTVVTAILAVLLLYTFL